MNPFKNLLALLLMLGKQYDALAVDYVSFTLLAIQSLEFEPVSGTHELNTILYQFSLKPTP